jgi:CheY-like chemotaxis protein
VAKRHAWVTTGRGSAPRDVATAADFPARVAIAELVRRVQRAACPQRKEPMMPIVCLPNIDDRVDQVILDHHRVLPVLLAEDDAEMRSLVSAHLRDDGYDPVEAQNGAELIRAIHRFEGAMLPVRLIITDIRMPGFTGLEVLEYLRYAGLRVPVILMTGFGDARTHAQAKDLDAVLVLDKPFDFEDLRAAVARLVPSVTAS